MLSRKPRRKPTPKKKEPIKPLDGVKAAFKSASLCGLRPDDFWALTPFAFSLIAEAHIKKSESEFDVTRWAIWHQAAFTRAKKMPTFKEFVRPESKGAKVPIDQEAIKARMKAYSARFKEETNGESRKP